MRDAAQGFVGGSLGWLAACTLAGGIMAGVTADHSDEPGWELALAWIGHLVVAGLSIWGLVVVCIHTWCLSELINGTSKPETALAVAFVAQLTTSAIVVLTFTDHPRWEAAVAWALCAGLAIGLRALGALLDMRRERRLDQQAKAGPCYF